MKKEYLFCILLSIGLAEQTARAQNARFSLYEMYTATLNPARTGSMSEDWRLSAIHREQWGGIGSRFMTTGISGEYVLRNLGMEKNTLGLGAFFTNDAMGEGILDTYTAGISLAYHHFFGAFERGRIDLGLQGAFHQYSIDLSGFRFGNQYEFFSFNPALSSGEPTADEQWSNTTLGTGANFKYRFSSTLSLAVGTAVYHFLGKKKSIYRNSVRQNELWVLHGLVNKRLRKKLSIMPHWQLLYQGGAYSLLTGMRWAYDLPFEKPLIVLAGLAYRYDDAMVFSAGLRWKRIQVMAAYDLTTSGLGELREIPSLGKGGLGAFEIGLTWSGWKNPAGDRRVALPCNTF